jgi:hypothetical protein
MKLKALCALLLPCMFLCGTPAHAQAKKFKELKAEFIAVSKKKDFNKFAIVCKSLAKLEDKKAIKFLLKEGLSFSDPDRHSYVGIALGGVTDKRLVGLMAKELKSSKSLAAKLTLCKVLRSIPGKPSGSALGGALKAKEDAVREAAAKALGRHASGNDFKSQLRRLLKDKSLRVQKSAAESLTNLGVEIKGYKQDWDAYGCPDRVFASDIAILFDTSVTVHQAKFKSLIEAKDKKAKAKAVSSLDNIVTMLATMFGGLTNKTRFKLGGFSTSTRTFDKKPTKASPKNVKKAIEWLKKKGFSKGDERDIYRAVKGMIDEDIDEIYVFTAGLQDGGAVENSNEVLNRLIDLAFSKGIRIHTIMIDEPPLKAPKNAQQEQRVNKKSYDLKDFGEALASKTGAHSGLYSPALFEGKSVKGRPSSGTGAGNAGSDKAGNGKNDVDRSGGFKAPVLKKGRVSASQLTAIKKQIKKSLAKPKAVESVEAIEAIGALPDASIAKRFLKDLVFGKSVGLSEAAIVGLSKNGHPGVVDVLSKKLKGERDSGRQVLLMRCLAAAVPVVSEKLIPIVPNLKRDAQRLALGYLAGRPAGELVAAKKSYPRKLKSCVGLSKAYLNVILGKAAAPSSAVPQNGYLPAAINSDGVAFLVDLTRASSQNLWVPAKKPEVKADKKTKKKKKDRKKKKGEKAEEKKLKEPVSRLQSMGRELQRVLYIVAKNKGRALVQELGESPPSSYGPLKQYDEKSIEGAENWMQKVAPVPSRDLASSIVRALRNPEVEEIYILTCGMPLRADLMKTEEILDAVDNANRGRQVRIHITAVYGVADENSLSDEAKAKRKDQVDQLEELYKTLADRNRGSYQLRLKRPLIAFKKPEKGKKK